MYCLPCEIDHCVKQLGGFFHTPHGERSVLYKILCVLIPESPTTNVTTCLAQFEAIHADHGVARQAVDRLRKYFQRRKETLVTETMWPTSRSDPSTFTSKEMHDDLHEALTNARYAHALMVVRRWLVTNPTMSPDEHAVLSKKMTCGICAQPISSRVKLMMCQHMICVSCSHKPAMNNQKKCPICHKKQPFLVKDAPHITSEVSTSHHRSETTTDQTSDEDLRSKLKIQSGFGTKIDAIVLDLLRTDLKECPRWSGNVLPAKSVVFSEWVDVLKTMAIALNRNGVSYLDMTSQTEKVKTKVNGSSIIDRFVHDPECLVRV